MKGWHKESYRHYLASKGVKTNYYAFKNNISNLLKLEKESGVSSLQIQKIKRSSSMKVNLLREEEYLRDILTDLGHDPDLEFHELDLNEFEPHVVKLYESLDIVNQKLRRITGNPAYKNVSGKTSVELRENLYDALKGTSQRKPEQVKEFIGVPLVKIERPIEKEIKRERVRRSSREIANFKRVIPILEQQAIEAAVVEKPVPLLKLKYVERSSRGRKVNDERMA